MKHLHKFILGTSLSLCLGVSALAAGADAEASALKTMELFKGTENGFELDRAPTRMEALIMLVRMTGNENDALYAESTKHPFTDAPDWEDAGKYLDYAFENGLTTGVTATTFNPDAPATAQMYATFMHRALGYEDAAEGSLWDEWEQLGKISGVLTDEVDTDDFMRGDAVLMSYAALSSTMQGEKEITLEQKLLEDGAITELTLSVANVIAGEKVNTSDSVKDIMGAIYFNTEEELRLSGLMMNEVTDENLAYYFGVEKLDFVEAVAVEPMMGSQAHSVGLIRVADGVDVEKTKAEIKAKVDPRKWICVGVEPENVHVDSIGNLIILAMDNYIVDEIMKNFKSLPDENGMFSVNGSYMEETDAIEAKYLDYFAKNMKNVKDKYLDETNHVFYATIADKTYYSKDVIADYIDHDVIMTELATRLPDFTPIDLTDMLTFEDYLHTDLHWKQESLFDVAAHLGKTMGFGVTESSYAEKTHKNFIGAYGDAITKPNAEELTWFTSANTEKAVVTDFNSKEPVAIYNTEALKGDMPYDLFLSGATPITVLENPSAKTDKELVLFRDSFGSALAPLLMEDYAKITMVDLRYMSSDLLGDYVDFADADVLFLYSDRLVTRSMLLK